MKVLEVALHHSCHLRLIFLGVEPVLSNLLHADPPLHRLIYAAIHAPSAAPSACARGCKTLPSIVEPGSANYELNYETA